jgi:glucosamine-6-phosphate deaminase
MEIIILPTDLDVAGKAADAIEEQVRSGPTNLGLATGLTPLATYQELIERHRTGGLSFANTKAFLLDEYVGLPATHPQSYHSVIRREFTGRVDFRADAVHGLKGTAADVAAEAERYEKVLEASGGVDIQILGIGTDGHVGFNEPMSSLASRTRIKTLTQGTRQDNARFFEDGEAVPDHVLTQGLGTILSARHLLLLAVGESKAEAVAAAVEGPVAAVCPASALQLHPHVTVIIDEAAASLLNHREYYLDTFTRKPAWQGL